MAACCLRNANTEVGGHKAAFSTLLLHILNERRTWASAPQPFLTCASVSTLWGTSLALGVSVSDSHSVCLRASCSTTHPKGSSHVATLPGEQQQVWVLAVPRGTQTVGIGLMGSQLSVGSRAVSAHYM